MLRNERTEHKRQVTAEGSGLCHQYGSIVPMLDRRVYCDVGDDGQADGLAATCALEASVLRIDATGLGVRMAFHPRYSRARAMLASVKSTLSGITDVVGIDGCEWSLLTGCGEPRNGGASVVGLKVMKS